MTAVTLSDLGKLYQEHITTKLNLVQSCLDETGYDALVIGSGNVHIQYADDLPYPFKPNAYIREWLPIGHQQNAFLLIPASGSARLYLDTSEDIWHTDPEPLPDYVTAALEVCSFTSQEELIASIGINDNNIAYIDEHNQLGVPEQNWQPETVCQFADYHRKNKSAYEQFCIRRANVMSVACHRAAEDRFRSGGSELDILHAYLQCGQISENDLPYPMVAGLNENAAVLHHFTLSNKAPVSPLSFLIDAGISFNGYPSDISRTYSFHPGDDFSTLIDALDALQQSIVDIVKPGIRYVDLHLDCHQKTARLLKDFGFITADEQDAIELGLTSVFMPHGIGHGLGTNVHERGGTLVSASGETQPPPAQFPNLRTTRTVEKNEIFTVEPGLYFIPALLEPLRASDKAQLVNWEKVEQYLPYGGIRIEDNILVNNEGQVENLTRDAFQLSSG